MQWNSRKHWFPLTRPLSVSLCRCIDAHPGDRPPQRGQGLRQRQLCPQRGALRADWLLRGLLHPTGHHGGDVLPHHTGILVCVPPPHVPTLPFLLFITLTSSIIFAPCRPQVLQRQATVFLYEAKTSSQQPLHTPAMTNTLQPPASTFHLPQINTLSPSDSQGTNWAGSLAPEMWFDFDRVVL